MQRHTSRLPPLLSPNPLFARVSEENVYQLCQRLLQEREAHKQRRAPEEDVDIDVYAVFISNEEERVLMYEQQSGDQHRGRIVWDYHVICITRTRSPSPASASPTSTSPSTSSLPPFLSPHPSRSCSLVYDLDSRLPFPCPFSLYVQRALLPAFSHSPSLHPLFRVAPAPLLLSTFASDRSHMLNDKGEWLAPPPAWPPLGHGHNLSEWKCITLDQVWPPSDPAGEHFGAVLDLTQLVTAFGPVDVDV